MRVEVEPLGAVNDDALEVAMRRVQNVIDLSRNDRGRNREHRSAGDRQPCGPPIRERGRRRCSSPGRRKVVDGDVLDAEIVRDIRRDGHEIGGQILFGWNVHQNLENGQG